MDWSVTYRAEDGGLSVGVFEAEDRESLFKVLAARGVAAVRVEQGVYRRPQASARKASPKAARVAVAGAAAIALALGAWRFLLRTQDEAEPVERQASPPGMAESAPKPAAPGPVGAMTPKKPLRFWEVDAAHTNGFTEMQMRKWRKEHMPPPGYTNNVALTRPKPKYAIFRHSCENLIAAYLTLRPGEGMVGTPVLGERFRRQFLESLKEPIVVSADDPPEDAQLKRDMIATKADLKARMEAGEDICKILGDTHREVQDLARYKAMLQKEVREASRSPDMTMQDVDDLVRAANEMLDARGIAPIALGPISRRLIQRRKGF